MVPSLPGIQHPNSSSATARIVVTVCCDSACRSDTPLHLRGPRDKLAVKLQARHP